MAAAAEMSYDGPVFDPFASKQGEYSGPIFDPFEPPKPPPRSALGEISGQFKAGLYDAARGIGATLQAPSEMAGQEPGIVAKIGKSIEQYGKEGAAQSDLQSQPEQHNGFTNLIAEGARGLPGALPLIASSIGGAAVGTAAGGPVGTLVGGAAGAGGQAALQTWHEQYRRYLAEHPGDDEAARTHANKSAALQGGLMAGVGAVTAGIGSGVGAIGKAAVGAGTDAAEAGTAAVSKTFLPEFAKGSAEMAAINTGLGVAGAAGQAGIDQSSGLPGPTPGEAAKAAFAPSLGGSIGFLPLTAWGAFGSARNAAALKSNLIDASADPAKRAAAVDQVHAVMTKADPEAADAWLEKATFALDRGQPIGLAADWKPDALPALPSPDSPATTGQMVAAPDGSVRPMTFREQQAQTAATDSGLTPDVMRAQEGVPARELPPELAPRSLPSPDAPMPDGPLIIDADGNASRMTYRQHAEQEAARQVGVDTGLTPDVARAQLHPADAAALEAEAQPDAGPLAHAAGEAVRTGATDQARVATAQQEAEQNRGAQEQAAGEDQKAAQVAQDHAQQAQADAEVQARQEVLQHVLSDKTDLEPTKTFGDLVGRPSKEELGAIQHEQRVRDQAAKEAAKVAEAKEGAPESSASSAKSEAEPSPALSESQERPASKQLTQESESSVSPAVSTATPKSAAEPRAAAAQFHDTVVQSRPTVERSEPTSGQAATAPVAPAKVSAESSQSPSAKSTTNTQPARVGDALRAAHETLIAAKAQKPPIQVRIVQGAIDDAKAIREGTVKPTRELVTKLRAKADTVSKFDAKASAAITTLADHVDATREKTPMEVARAERDAKALSDAKAQTGSTLESHFADDNAKPVHVVYAKDGDPISWSVNKKAAEKWADQKSNGIAAKATVKRVTKDDYKPTQPDEKPLAKQSSDKPEAIGQPYSGTAPTGLRLTQIAAIVKKVAEKSRFPIEINHGDPQDWHPGFSSDNPGAYFRGKVTIFSRNIGSTADLYRVLTHELVGHASVIEMMGKQYDGLVRTIQAAKATNPEIKRLAQIVSITHSGDSAEAIARSKITDGRRPTLKEIADARKEAQWVESSEIIAAAAEEAFDSKGNLRQGYGWFKQVLSHVAEWLRSMGINVQFSGQELAGLIGRAASRLSKVEKKPEAIGEPALAGKSDGLAAASASKVEEAKAPRKGSYSLFSGMNPDERPKSAIFESLQKIFAPASRGQFATLQAGIMRDNLAQMARRSEVANEDMKKYAAAFDKMSQADQIKFTNDYERGILPADPALREAAKQMRAFNDERRKMIQELGTGKLEEFNDNYLGRIWKDPESKVNAVFQRRALEGNKNFLKRRTYEYFSQGLEAGLKPITYNPVEMMLLKGVEADRYIYGQKIFAEMKQAGIVAKWKPNEAPPGFTPISDKIAQAGEQRYYAPDEAATLLNNHLSPGLQGNGAYDAFRKAGMMLNGAQLGLSLFHLGFTTLDSMVSKAALGAQQLSRGQFLKGVGNIASSINPATPFLNAYKGDRLLRAYLGELHDPNMVPIVEALVHGGGRVRLDAFYRNATLNEFKQALSRNDKLGAAKSFLPTVLDRINAPVFEHLVPRQKLGVFFDLAKDWVERNPNATLNEKREAMAKVWDSVDNRMGQLAYDNVFWNRTLKDALMITVRSVGWNLGTFRELGGGALDVKNILKNKELSTRTAYVLALPFVTAIMGSMIGYLYTGKGPDELKDYFFPKTGRKRPDGTDDRVSLPSYMKDIYEYGHDISGFIKYGANPTQTLQNKLHPLIGIISQMVNNKDFLGGSIRSPGDPFVQQLTDEAKYLGNQLVPFGLRNYVQQSKVKREEPTVAGYLTAPAMIGVTPAPAYIAKNDQQSEAAALGAQKDALITKFREELQNGANPAEISKRMFAAGLRLPEIHMVLRQGLSTAKTSTLPPRRLFPQAQ